MKSAWKQLPQTPDEEADLKAALSDGRNAFAFLVKLLEKRLSSSRNEMVRDNYDCQNWSEKQADLNGVQRTYIEIINLIKDVE